MSFIVEFILHKFLDKFFYGIDKKNIEAGILDGRISISNIGLQQNIFDNLNFPIKMNYSYVEKVELQIPWRSQQTPINIYISNIYVLISAKDKNVNVMDIFMKKKEKALRDGIEAYLKNLKEDPKNQKEAGMIENKIKKLLHNINVNIGCIHCRYEAEPTRDGAGASFGLKINNINLYNVNKEGKKQFFNYQKSKEKIIRFNLSIDFIGLYVNSKETKFIFKKTMQGAKLARSTSLGDKSSYNKKDTKQASKRDYAYLTNEMRQISFPQKLSTSQTIHQELHYIFVISVKTLVSYNLKAKQLSKQSSDDQTVRISPSLSNVAIISFDIDFPAVSFKISQDQFYDIKKISEFFSSFKTYWNDYVSAKNLVIVKDKNYVDMSILLKQKKKKAELNAKEKFQLRFQCRKYIRWVFLTVFQERLKRSFLVEALKKDVTIQNLLKNKKITKIINKINEEKLKSWTMEAVAYRKKFIDSTTIFERYSDTKIKEFLNKILGTFESVFTKNEDISFKNQSQKEELFSHKPYQFEFSMKINLLTIEVSKLDKFGVGILMKNLRSQFLKRKKNFSFQIRIQDLEANLFSTKNNQKRKTIVPIVRKSIIQSKDVDLLYLKYQKNPVESLYINAEYELDFESIEIIIYPEAFKQFYAILFARPQKSNKMKQIQAKKKKATQKKTQSMNQTGQNRNTQYQSANLLRRNMLKGKIRSPWIIMPLGRNNNPQKQCWVVRLGDFNLETPQVDGADFYKEKENLYEKYTLELKQFELKFFSSVKFFYNWLKFNQNEEALFSIPYYKNMKIVNMINPFTCRVEFSTLKNGLSSTIKSKNFSYISNIHIEGIQIFLSNFLLEKLKERLDIMDEQEKQEEFEFIEQNVENIYEEHLISGWAKVTNQKWKEMKFFIVLKGHFLYYFVSENESKYYFFTDVRKSMIRLVGRQIEKINQQIKEEKVSIFLEDPSMLGEWKKHIIFCLQKKQKKVQVKKQEENHLTNDEQMRALQVIEKIRYNAVPSLQQLPSPDSPSKVDRELVLSHSSQSRTKMSITFIMNSLEIKLKDKEEKEFLLCYFKKSNFTYRCLYSPQAAFSLSSWDVFESYEHKEKEIPFLSSKKFYNSDEDGGIRRQETGENTGFMKETKERNNFLEVRVNFNSITNQLSDIYVDIDKLFIAWKVDLITKILTFFFYSSEMGEAPTPYTVEKRTLGVRFEIKKFYLYAYQGPELAGLIKLQDATIIYYQSSIQEFFDVKFMKLQIDKSINNSLDKREAMLISKGPENPFKLKYHIRKKNFKKIKEFQTVEHLKEEFGPNTIVSLLTCELQDCVVIYEHQLTFRMLNYLINHVLGTIAAKFKKRSYSPKYIHQVLKMQKVNTMQIKIKDFTFVLPPHDKTQNHLVAQIPLIKITKNTNRIIPELKPCKVSIPTKFQPVNVFFETMFIECMNVQLFQKFGKEVPVPINKKPIDLKIMLSKINLNIDHYNVLKHHDDFDRRSVMKIQFLDELALEVPKVTFVTLLLIFYQNIRQKDGKAELFEHGTPLPPRKQYIIQFPSIKANLYEFDEKEKTLIVFNKIKLQKFHIVYENQGTKSQMNFSSTSINSEGQLPLDVWNSKTERVFTFKMNSDTSHSTTKIELNVKGYQLDFSMNKLNNILEFINYDSDYVANKKMPPKVGAFMCVNVFASDCLVRMEELWATGEFLVTYTKGAKNFLDPKVLEYLEVENLDFNSSKYIQQRKSQDMGRHSISEPKKEDIIDKEIKVDGQNIKLSIRGDTIGQITSLYFHREDLSTKKSMKRFKKQTVQIGEGVISVQISDLERIFNAYEKRIKRIQDFVLKSFFQPWNALPVKLTFTEKRRTEVEFAKINAFLIPNEKKNSLFYFMFDVKIPHLTYSTFGKDQQITVDLGATISQQHHFLYPEMIGEIKKMKIVYKNNKQKANKDIQISNANDLNFYLANLNTKALYVMSQQISTMSASNKSSSGPKIRKYLNYNYAKNLPLNSFITINNTTSFQITMQIGNLSIMTVQNFKQHQQKLNFQQLLEIFMEDSSTITIDAGNKKNVFKEKLKSIPINKEIQISEEMIVKFTIENDTFVVHLFEGCIIKNNTKLNLYIYSAQDKQFKIHSGEEKCFSLVDTSGRRLSSSHLNIHRKIEKILVSLLNPSNSASKDFLKDKGEEISLKHSGEEQIFNNLILVKKIKRNGTLTIELKERYILSNFTPFKINLGNNQMIKYKQNFPLSHGLYSQKIPTCSSKSYPISINNHIFELNLKKSQQYFEVDLSSQSDSSDQSQKMKINVHAKKMTVKVFVKDVKTDNNQVSNIFLFTKIIFQSLTVERILLLGHSLSSLPKNDIKEKGYQIDHDQLIAFNQDLPFLFMESTLTEKRETFNLRQLSSQLDKSKSNQNKTIYGQSFYLIEEKVTLGNSLKDQMIQNHIKICDCWILANITPFLVKIKGGVDTLGEEESKPNTKMRMQNQDLIKESGSSIFDIEINCNQQKPIPYDFLVSQKNLNSLAPFLQVCFMDLKNQIKFYRQLKISQQNISYIEVGEEICKVTIIAEKNSDEKEKESKDSSVQNALNTKNNSRWLRIILESSDEGYKVENSLGDLVVEVKNGDPKNNKSLKSPKISSKKSGDKSYISDGYQIEDELNLEHSNSQILIQPQTSKNLGIKSFSSSGLKMLTLSFYYPQRNIDFKQSVVLELDNLSALAKKQILLTDTSKKSSFTILVLTEMLKENKFHIKLYKKSLYEESIPEILKFSLKQLRLSLYLGEIKKTAQFEEEKIKLQLCDLYLLREKHIDMQNFDVKLQKILLIEGNTLPIIAAIDKRKKFLNLQAILQKAPHGLKGKHISMKLTPFEINGRQGIILRLLQKIAKIRSYKMKASKLQSLMPRKNTMRVSMERQRIVNLQFTIPESNIEKEWELLKKGSKPIALDLLEVFSTSIFLSYTKSQQMLQNSPFLSDPILKYFLLLPSIGETKLPIPDFEIKNFNGATKELLKLIAKELKSTIGQSILYSLTSLSIFDNPIQAVDDLVRYMMTILQTI